MLEATFPPLVVLVCSVPVLEKRWQLGRYKSVGSLHLPSVVQCLWGTCFTPERESAGKAPSLSTPHSSVPSEEGSWSWADEAVKGNRLFLSFWPPAETITTAEICSA